MLEEPNCSHLIYIHANVSLLQCAGERAATALATQAGVKHVPQNQICLQNTTYYFSKHLNCVGYGMKPVVRAKILTLN
jgi:hypothetical protein